MFEISDMDFGIVTCAQLWKTWTEAHIVQYLELMIIVDLLCILSFGGVCCIIRENAKTSSRNANKSESALLYSVM